MASQTPSDERKTREYENGWAATTKLMESGQSWSGRERKSAFLNLRDGSFATVSAAAGIDLPDDGRALAVTDWDGDGDLDLWFKMRTGPQLRFFRNDNGTRYHFLSLLLEGNGKGCNRDAIGARVEVVAGGKRRIQELAAGSGYLSQSSRWLHFGLGQDEKVEKVVVRWPGGGVQEFEGVAPDKRHRIAQGSPEAKEFVRPAAQIAGGAAPSSKPESGSRIVLRVPLPLPPAFVERLRPQDASGRPILLNLWASWCQPCLKERAEFEGRSREIGEAGLRIVPLEVESKERERLVDDATLTILEALLRNVRHVQEEISLPTSFLVDRAGEIQVVYVGPVAVDQLLEDARAYGLEADPAAPRSPFPGRWFYYVPRDFPALAKDLRRSTRDEEARFYDRLAEEMRRALEKK